VAAGTLNRHVGVTVSFPNPVFAAALKSFVAVGAVVAAGSVYGYAIAFVASVQAAPASHAVAGAVVTVVDDVASVFAPAVNVVDVAVMFQPAPPPVASLTSSAWVCVTVWSAPFNVAVKVTFGGVDTNANVPAVMVAVPVAAYTGATLPITIAITPNSIGMVRRRRRSRRVGHHAVNDVSRPRAMPLPSSDILLPITR
jgi:hypothetical protein